MRLALVNGKPADSISVTDRGLHYGDGLFETLRVHAGTAEFAGLHLDRLARGCARLGLAAPDSGVLESELEAGAAAMGEGVLKLIVTRGSAGRGYRPPRD